MGYVGSYECCDLEQDTYAFSSFFSLEFSYTVVSLYDLLWFDENGFTGSRLVVYDTSNLTFVGRWHG